MMWIFFIVTLKVLLTHATVTIKIKLLSYSVNGRDWTNQKCDNVITFNPACDPKFTLCLDKGDGNDDFNSCSYARYQTGHYQGQNSITFSTTLAGGIANPIGGSYAKYQGLKFKTEVFDDDSGHSGADRIDKIYYVTQEQPAKSSAVANWVPISQLGIRTSTAKSTLKFSVTVYCDANYYSTSCDVYCLAADTDQSGHYTCNPDTGEIICRPGWETTAELCKVKINDCENNACLNGATCVDGYKTYTCDCAPGFTGDKCETNVDECTSNPCTNNGTCVDGNNAYSCDCLSQYTGDICQHHVCDVADFCYNGGTCYEEQGNVSCICPQQYTGIHCDVDKCEVLQCQNGGTCVNGTCLCSANYIGTVCDIDLCNHISCTNGGSCIQGHCDCVDGYTGQYCHVNINECISNPCSHGGTCKDQVNGYYCSCLPQYNGTHCQTYLPTISGTGNQQNTERPVIESNGGNQGFVAGIIIPIIVLIVVAVILLIVFRRRRYHKDRDHGSPEQGAVPPEGLDHFSNPLYNDSVDVTSVAATVAMPPTKEYPPGYLENMAAPPPYTLHPTDSATPIYSELGDMVKQAPPTDNVVEVSTSNNDEADLCGAVGGVPNGIIKTSEKIQSFDNEVASASLYDTPKNIKAANTSIYDSPKNIKSMHNNNNNTFPPEEWTPVKKPKSGEQNKAFSQDEDEDDTDHSYDVVRYGVDRHIDTKCDTNTDSTEENPYVSVVEVDSSIHNNSTNEKLETENSIDESNI